MIQIAKKKKRIKICLTLDEDIIKPMKETKKKTGLSIARQIEMKLKGYELREFKPIKK